MSADAVLLRRLGAHEIPQFQRQAYDDATLAQAKTILDDVRKSGEDALRAHAERLGDIKPGAALFADKERLAQALQSIPAETRATLERTAARIRSFAEAQKNSLAPLRYAIPGGHAGHDILPVDIAGCYAPGGRFSLPSSVLMTVIPARVAGVRTIWVASPKANDITLAAAAIAGADGLLTIGGAQAIAALACGTSQTTRCDVIVGPGNRWVTAAKQLIAGEIAIDMLAGPSELLVFADDSAQAETIAADLLAQAEHDPDALPVLVTTSAALYEAVNAALAEQIKTLPTAPIARQALQKGFAVCVGDVDSGIEICNRLAPEHLELMLREPAAVAPRLRHCGGLFIGSAAAEVIGDYGAGPNHTLPTGGTSRSRAGLSVFTFLRTRTWIDITDPAAAQELYGDAASLAHLEGLEAHARAAELRRR
jgi:phosphoribosyl-ATP pyrophosphohydrolase/phosphoribosyl-AMP cyclohydrolase/histidinol dehydrogenase